MFFEKVFGVLLATACVTCYSVFPPKPMLDGRIVGGKEIDITDAPWQVSLRRSGSHNCGASIISEKWILTAAHCVDSSKPSSMSIRAGSASNRKGGDIYAVKKIYQHPDFDRAVIDFDYALLELEDEIELDETKQIVKLHDQDEEIADGTTCTISGWGNTQDGSDQSLLRKVETKIVNQEKCANAYKNVGKITPRMICAGADEGGKDSCQGDSGGPLTVLSKDGKTRLLAGIVSWGYGCAVRGYPGVYSRVLGGRDWIKEISGI